MINPLLSDGLIVNFWFDGYLVFIFSKCPMWLDLDEFRVRGAAGGRRAAHRQRDGIDLGALDRAVVQVFQEGFPMPILSQPTFRCGDP